jgi:hypothetical protein
MRYAVYSLPPIFMKVQSVRQHSQSSVKPVELNDNYTYHILEQPEARILTTKNIYGFGTILRTNIVKRTNQLIFIMETSNAISAGSRK